MSSMTSPDAFLTDADTLRAVMDTVIDGLITIDADGTIRSFNRAAVKIFGYEPEEVIGRNVKMLMPEPYHSEHDGYIANYHRTGDPKIIGHGREVSARRKDGSVFPISLGVSEMQVGGMRVYVGIIRDITERREMERERAQFIAELARSNQELDDFAYIASHDLKEPLRGVANNATFLKEDYENALDEKGIKRLNRMVFLCQRMERLVDDLLYFSRLGRQKLAVQPTDLNIVVKDIEAMLETTLHEQRAEIVVPRPLPTITCDAPRITEVFRNLITNAIKYNKSESKRIEVGCTNMVELVPESPDERVFYVRDNGIGIAPEFHREIFRIFKRLNDEDDTSRGSGVGLTFVQKIIERHNGRIWLDSDVGRGSTFYFTINAPQETAAG
jgi:two-component system, LuxR family, sensor kinase FixL